MMFATIAIYALCTFGPGGCGASGDGFDATRPHDLAPTRVYKACLSAPSKAGSLSDVRSACAAKAGVRVVGDSNYTGPMVSLESGKPVSRVAIPPVSLRNVSCAPSHTVVKLDAMPAFLQSNGATIVTTARSGVTTKQHVGSRFAADLWPTCVGVQVAISEIDATHPMQRRVRIFNRSSDGARWIEFTGSYDPYTANLPATPLCGTCAAVAAYWEAVDLAVRKVVTTG